MSKRAPHTDDTRAPKHQGPIDDQTLERLSAFLDGALSPDDEATIVARIDAEPRLADALAELAMVRGALASERSPVDVADRVMAVVDPRGLSDDAEGVELGSMLLADVEASLDQVAAVPAHDAAAHAFLVGVEAVRGHLSSTVGRAALDSSRVAERVSATLVDDERALELALSLQDGEGGVDTVAALSALLDDATHGARRVREVEEAVAARRAVAAHVTRPTTSAEATRVAAQVERALATAPARVTAPVSIFSRVARFAPAGLAVAALALFVLLGRVDDPRPTIEPDLPVDLVASAPFDVLPDNTSTVEALETGGGSAVVFSTPASHITIIWVGGTGTAEQGT